MRARRRNHWRVTAAATVLVLLAARGDSEDEAKATTQPAPPVTVRELRTRLAQTPLKDRGTEERLLDFGLAFVDAVARADGPAAAEKIDMVGYQVLPVSGELPERPDKPVAGSEIDARVAVRRSRPIDALPAELFALAGRDRVRSCFPAVGEWMLDEDRALLVRPSADESAPQLVKHAACVVIRARGGRMTVVGGNLLQALVPAEPDAEPTGKPD